MALCELPFGLTTDGQNAHLYLLSNERGMTVVVTEVGASVVSVRVPSSRGGLQDVALGHASARAYERAHALIGATVGRVANRTAEARFTLDGRVYQLAVNEHANNNHSGPDMWCSRVWKLADKDERHVTFVLHSPDGDQGFPGEVTMRVTYELTDDNQLIVRQEATPETRTPINVTNHTYWNLDGHASGSTLGHSLSIDAAYYLPVNGENIPIAGPTQVEGTPFDLRSPRVLEDIVKDLPYGLDHNFCLRTVDDGPLAHAARLVGGRSGIVLDVFTDAPGLQVYMGGWLDRPLEKDGASYGQFGGIALETQHWPDTLHHPDWPSVIYGPERPFSQTAVFAFSSTIAGEED